MIKEDLILTLAQELNITNLHAKKLLTDFLQCLEKTILEEQKLLISGFGLFEIRKRKRIFARNPKTMQQVIVPPRKALCFRASPRLKKLINTTNEKSIYPNLWMPNE